MIVLNKQNYYLINLLKFLFSFYFIPFIPLIIFYIIIYT